MPATKYENSALIRGISEPTSKKASNKHLTHGRDAQNCADTDQHSRVIRQISLNGFIQKNTMTLSGWMKPQFKPYALAVIPLLLITAGATLATHMESAFAQPVDGVQTLVFMRHAEKPADGLGQLNCQGLNRAINLATLLPQRYGNADYIFAADPSRQVEEGANDDAYNYVRPLMTINPSAIKLGLPINLEFSANDTRDLANELTRDKYHNATVYTAWSHGYLPDLINSVAGKALGKKTTLTEDWSGNDFDSLYVLTLTWKNGEATLNSRVDQQGLNNGTHVCPT